MKKLITLVLAAALCISLGAPAFAATRVLDDEFPYDSVNISGSDKFEFSTTTERPYYRIGIHNTSDLDMTMRVYTVSNDVETKIYSTTIAPDKWNPSMSKYAPSTDFVIRLSMTNGAATSGLIRVRLSANDILSKWNDVPSVFPE